jgi:hypothetical protein
MKLAHAAALATAAAFVVTSTARSQTDAVHERIFEINPFAGAFLTDEHTKYSGASPLTGFRASLNNSSRWALEGMFALSPAQSQEFRNAMLESYDAHVAYDAGGSPRGVVFTNLVTSEGTAESSSSLFLAGGSILAHVSGNRFRPFVSVGAGFIEDLASGDDAPPSPFSNLFYDLGFGFKYFRTSGWGLRLDIRDYVMRRDDLPQPNSRAALLAAQRDLADVDFDPNDPTTWGSDGGTDGVVGEEPFSPDSYRGKRWLNNYAVTLSLTVPLGWAWKDGDGDMVEDRFDKCLTTAPGVIVDPVGCGIDSDEDGVFDGLDSCGETPRGATVDLQGCPSDADADGVFDGLDQCADSPAGALVSAEGCPSDRDGDGVLDGLDRCDDTPLGAGIDANGCVQDPIEERLLHGSDVVLDRVEFESGEAELRPLSYHQLNKIGRVIERWTGSATRPLRIEIAVTTDGGPADLGQRRAEAVRGYVLRNFPETGANNLVGAGYPGAPPGESTDTSRRVVVRVIGPGAAPERATSDAAGAE